VSTSPPEPTSNRFGRLDKALLSGLAWVTMMKWGVQVFTWTTTLVVARLLDPSDYGLVGMAMVYIGLVQMISEFGISFILLSRRDLTEDQIAHLGGLALIVGIFFAFLSLALAPVLAQFFNEPRVAGIVVLYSVLFPVAALRALPQGLMARDLEFKKLAKLGMSEGVTASIVSLALAFSGWGYWSLVLGNLAGAVVVTLLLVSNRPQRLARPSRWSQVTPFFRFGSSVIVSKVAWYSYNNADFAIVGRVLGKVQLGYYSLAWQLATLPAEKIAAIIGQVVPPIFASVAGQPEDLRRYLARLCEGLTLIILPGSIGLALVASPLLESTLGTKWLPAVPALQVLAAVVTIRSLSSLFHFVLFTTGRPEVSAKSNLWGLALLPALFWIGTRGGITGVALAWLVGFPVLLIIPFRATQRVTGISLSEILRALWPAVESTGYMTLAVLGVGRATQALHPAVRLGAMVATGVVVYGAVVSLRHRTRLRAFISVVRSQGATPEDAKPPNAPEGH